MAKENVETKVVQVRFDNTKFSKNINTTIKQCKQLDKNLQFKGSKKDIQEVQKALKGIEIKNLNKDLENTEGIVHKISVGFGELFKIKLLTRAMDTVINKTESMVKSMLGIGNIVNGWEQYETQVVNVGGILNQVEAKGKTIEDVADAMARLQWYTDETSFSFTTLSDGIRQFVVAGIDLEAATEAAMGVTNLAGSAKVFDGFKVQSAMNAISKAMQNGKMNLMQWTTLTNTAGIVTEEFTQALIEAGEAEQTLHRDSTAMGQYKTKKGGKLVTKENIASTLRYDWVTEDVLARALAKYSSASTAVEKFTGLIQKATTKFRDTGEEDISELNEMLGTSFGSIRDIFNAMPESVGEAENGIDALAESINSMASSEAIDYMQALGYQFDAVGLKAYKSSMETTSLSQAIKYVKDTITTQWAGIFQAIFGDTEKATALWSDVASELDEIFVAPFRNLRAVIDNWSELTEGGAEDFRSTIFTIIEVIGKFKKTVAEGFAKVFGGTTQNTLQAITLKLKNFFETLRDNETLWKSVGAVSKIIASALKIYGKVMSTIFKIATKLFTALEPVFEIIVEILDMIADGLIWLINTIDELGILDGLVKGIATALGWLAKGIKNVINWIKGKVDLEKVTNGLAKAIDWLKRGLDWIIKNIKKAANAVKDWWQQSGIAQRVTESFAKAVDSVKSFFGGFKKSSDEVSEGMEQIGETSVEAAEGVETFSEAGEKAANKMSFLEKMKIAFKTIGNFFVTVWNGLKSFLIDTGFLNKVGTALSGLWSVIKQIVGPLWESIKKWLESVKQLADENPEEAVKKIGKAIAAIIGILLMFKITSIVSAAQWSLEEIAKMFKAFRKKILAERWKLLAGALLIITVSIFILTMAINNMADIDYKSAWKALVAILGILTVYAAVLMAMNSQVFKKNAASSLRMLGLMVGLSIGISAFVRAFNKVLDSTKGKTWNEIAKAGVIILVIGELLVDIIAVTFKKVERKGFFKGEFIKGPGMFAFLRTMLFVWLFCKTVLWFTNKLTKGNIIWQLLKAGSVVVTIFIVLAAIYTAISNMIIVKQKDKKNVIEMGSFMMGVAVSVMVCSLALKLIANLNLTVPQILKAGVTTLALYTAIAVIVGAMQWITKVITKGRVRKTAIKISSSMMAIAVSMLATIWALKILANTTLTMDEIWRIGKFVLAVYAIVGILAIALALTSKKIGFSIGPGGAKFVGARSPVASAIRAITASVFMAVLAIYLLDAFTLNDFWDAYKKFAYILGFISACIVLIQLTGKKNDGKAALRIVISLISAIVASMVVVIGLSYLPWWTLPASIGVLLLFASTLALINIIIAKANKVASMTVKQAMALLVTVGAIAAMMAVTIASFLVIKHFGKDVDPQTWITFGVVFGVAIGVIIGMIFIIKHLLKTMKDEKITKTNIKHLMPLMGIMGIMIAIFGAIEGLLVIATLLPLNKMLSALAAFGIVSAVMVGMMFAMKFLINKSKKIKAKDIISLYKLVGVMGTMIGAILLALGGVAVALQYLIYLDSKGNLWKAVLVALALIGMIEASLLGLAGISKLVKGLGGYFKILAMVPVMLALTSVLLVMATVVSVIETFTISWRTIGVLGAAAAVMVGVILILTILSHFMRSGKFALALLGLAVVALTIGIIAQSLTAISKIEDPWEAFKILAATIGVITLVLLLFSILAAIPGFGQAGVAIGILAVLAIAAAAYVLAMALELLSGCIGDLVDGINSFVNNVVAAAREFGQAINEFLHGMAETIVYLLDGVLTSITNFLDKSADVFDKVATTIVTSVEDLLKAFSEFLQDIVDIGKELDGTIIGNLFALAGAITALSASELLASLAGLTSSLADFAGSLIDVGSAIAKDGQKVLEFFGRAIDEFGDQLFGNEQEEELEIIERRIELIERLTKAIEEYNEATKDNPEMGMKMWDATFGQSAYINANTGGIMSSLGEKALNVGKAALNMSPAGQVVTLVTNNEFTLTDALTYGYDAVRSIGNTVADAAKSAASTVGGWFKSVFT